MKNCKHISSGGRALQFIVAKIVFGEQQSTVFQEDIIKSHILWFLS